MQKEIDNGQYRSTRRMPLWEDVQLRLEVHLRQVGTRANLTE